VSKKPAWSAIPTSDRRTRRSNHPTAHNATVFRGVQLPGKALAQARAREAARAQRGQEEGDQAAIRLSASPALNAVM
jgi:hypothetical protein